MKFTVNGDTLYQHVSMVSRIMASKSMLPILDCVLFNLKGGELELIASDGDNTMQTKMSVSDSDGDISIAMPAKLVMEAFKNLTAKSVSFIIDEENLVVKIESGSYNSSFNGMEATSFPKPKEMDAEVRSFTIQPNHFAAAINNTIFAASTMAQRPIVMGLNMEIEGNSLRMVGTDSFMLSDIKVPIVSSTGDTQVVMPAKGSNMLKSLLTKEGEDVIVTFDTTNIMVALGDSIITIRQVEGKYPNVKNAVPADPNKHVTVNRLDWISAIRAISPFQDQTTNLVVLDINGEGMHLTSRDTTQGLNSENQIGCSLIGEDFRIGFKSPAMISILSNMDTENVVMRVATTTKGVLFEPVYEEETKAEDENAETNTSARYERYCLLMPLSSYDY